MPPLDARATGLPVPVVRWIFAHSHKHYWRVASWYEIDDLIQDGLVIALKCLERYGPILDNAYRVRLNGVSHPHYMALVKSAFNNHITDLARRKPPEDRLADVSPDKTEAQIANVIPDPEPVLDLWLLLAEMPEYLRRACMLFFKHDTAVSVRHSRERLRRDPDTLTERIRAMAGFPQDEDFEDELRVYLWKREFLDC